MAALDELKLLERRFSVLTNADVGRVLVTRPYIDGHIREKKRAVEKI